MSASALSHVVEEFIHVRNAKTGKLELFCPGCGATEEVPQRGQQQELFFHDRDCLWAEQHQKGFN